MWKIKVSFCRLFSLPAEPQKQTVSLEHSHIGVQLEVPGPVSKGKVVLGQFGLGRVEGHLVAGQPALVAQHGGGVDDGTLEVHVTAQIHKVTLVSRLQLSTLLTEQWV